MAPFEPEFLDLMPETLTWYPVGARDGYGNVTVSTVGTPIRCRYVRQPKAVRNANGDEIVANGQAWLAGVYGVTVDDKVVLPDGSSPEIVEVGRFSDEDGPHHEVIYCA